MQNQILKMDLISTILLLNSKHNPYNFKLTFESLENCTVENLEGIRDMHIQEYNKQLQK